MTMYPIVPDYQKYPGIGRSPKDTYGEIVSAGPDTARLVHGALLELFAEAKRAAPAP